MDEDTLIEIQRLAQIEHDGLDLGGEGQTQALLLSLYVYQEGYLGHIVGDATEAVADDELLLD